MRASGRILEGKLRQGRWGRVERGPLKGSKVIRLSVEYLSMGRQLGNVQYGGDRGSGNGAAHKCGDWPKQDFVTSNGAIVSSPY